MELVTVGKLCVEIDEISTDALFPLLLESQNLDRTPLTEQCYISVTTQ